VAKNTNRLHQYDTGHQLLPWMATQASVNNEIRELTERDT
jgi:hypothetical protein